MAGTKETNSNTNILPNNPMKAHNLLEHLKTVKGNLGWYEFNLKCLVAAYPADKVFKDALAAEQAAGTDKDAATKKAAADKKAADKKAAEDKAAADKKAAADAKAAGKGTTPATTGADKPGTGKKGSTEPAGKKGATKKAGTEDSLEPDGSPEEIANELADIK
jgi:peptidoglycan hydrolase CwlO-like protein